MIVSLESVSLSEVDQINADFEALQAKSNVRRERVADPYVIRPDDWFMDIRCVCGTSDCQKRHALV